MHTIFIPSETEFVPYQVKLQQQMILQVLRMRVSIAGILSTSRESILPLFKTSQRPYRQKMSLANSLINYLISRFFNMYIYGVSH